jgi:hypothetical protein
MQHHAQDAVDAEPGVPEARVVHESFHLDSLMRAQLRCHLS